MNTPMVTLVCFLSHWLRIVYLFAVQQGQFQVVEVKPVPKLQWLCFLARYFIQEIALIISSLPCMWMGWYVIFCFYHQIPCMWMGWYDISYCLPSLLKSLPSLFMGACTADMLIIFLDIYLLYKILLQIYEYCLLTIVGFDIYLLKQTSHWSFNTMVDSIFKFKFFWWNYLLILGILKYDSDSHV